MYRAESLTSDQAWQRHSSGEIPYGWEVFPNPRDFPPQVCGTWKVFCVCCDTKCVTWQMSAMVRSSLQKLASSWIKTGEMEKKDATIYEAVLYPSRERGRLYHHQHSLSSCSPWIAPTSRHPDLQLVRSGCCNRGSLGREGWFGREEGLLLSSPSPQHVSAVCCMYSY